MRSLVSSFCFFSRAISIAIGRRQRAAASRVVAPARRGGGVRRSARQACLASVRLARSALRIPTTADRVSAFFSAPGTPSGYLTSASEGRMYVGAPPTSTSTRAPSSASFATAAPDGVRGYATSWPSRDSMIASPTMRATRTVRSSVAGRDHALGADAARCDRRRGDTRRRRPRPCARRARRRSVASSRSSWTSCASAASDDTAHSGHFAANAMPFAVAMPIRRPVNESGPAPIATASRSCAVDRPRATHTASISTSRSEPWPRSSPRRLGEHDDRRATIATLAIRVDGIDAEDDHRNRCASRRCATRGS